MGCSREGKARLNSRELAGEFSNEDNSEETVLAVEVKRAWNGCSGIERGVSKSGSEDASDIATSISASVQGKAMQLGRFAIC